MADAEMLVTAHLSRYNALLRLSKALAGHRTMAELFHVLADHLHTVVPFDYLALILHDEATNEMRLVVLEPTDVVVPFSRGRSPSKDRRRRSGKRRSEPSSPSPKKALWTLRSRSSAARATG